jgi:hypothetical protein
MSPVSVSSETVILRAFAVIVMSFMNTPGYLSLSHSHFIPYDHQFIIQHTETSEGCSKYEGAVDTCFPFSVECCFTPSTLSHVNQHKARAARDDVVINTSTGLGRICRRLELNIGKYCGGKVQFNGDMRENKNYAISI